MHLPGHEKKQGTIGYSVFVEVDVMNPFAFFDKQQDIVIVPVGFFRLQSWPVVNGFQGFKRKTSRMTRCFCKRIGSYF